MNNRVNHNRNGLITGDLPGSLLRTYDQLSRPEANGTDAGRLRDTLRDYTTGSVVTAINQTSLSAGYRLMKAEEVETVGGVVSMICTFLVAFLVLMIGLTGMSGFSTNLSTRDGDDAQPKVEPLD